MLIGSIVAFFLAVILFVVFLFPPSLAMAQQQTTSTAPTISSSPSSLSITTIPPLTPEELQQQNRLQNVIAATTRDLNETEKEVSGVVFTPRWSDVAWINANSISVLIAYCLPGEFADSGQEILGGFGLEVLESYAVDLPQGFMAWMAVVGNQDIQNRRFPAALGVICASDLNNTDTRVLSPEEQQQINNVISQFTTIQNTQITNIDQVINIIDDVTEPTTTEGQPLRAEIIIANTTRAINNATNYKFDAGVTGGTPPYNYHWRWILPVEGLHEGSNRSFGAFLQLLGTHTILLNVTDSKNQTASDTLQITVGGPPTNDTGTIGEPLRVEIIPNATEGIAPATIKFDSKVTGGTEPYTYQWNTAGGSVLFPPEDRTAAGFEQELPSPNTFYFILDVTDSKGQTASDTVQIVIRERPQGGVLPPPETGEEGQPGGGGLLPSTPPSPPPPPNDNEVISPPEGDGGGSPPEAGEEGGGEEEPSPPPSDDTEEGDGTPPSTTDEQEPPSGDDTTGGG